MGWQELRGMNVLGMFCGETQQQMHRVSPQPSVTATVLVPSPTWVLLYPLDLFPFLPGEGGARAEEGNWVGLSWTDGRGLYTLYRIITIPISFVLLAKVTVYNHVWPWESNYFQPRSLWERWWLHSSPVS